MVGSIKGIGPTLVSRSVKERMIMRSPETMPVASLRQYSDLEMPSKCVALSLACSARGPEHRITITVSMMMGRIDDFSRLLASILRLGDAKPVR